MAPEKKSVFDHSDKGSAQLFFWQSTGLYAFSIYLQYILHIYIKKISVKTDS